MIGLRWRALGCEVHVVTRDLTAQAAAGRVVARHLAALDATCSRFRDSELTRLRPGRQRVSPLLGSLIRVALDAAERTDGLVDPTLGRSLCALGYDRTFDQVDDGPVGNTAPGRWQEVVLDDDLLELPDIQLDLGATAKAWAADRAAAEVATRYGDAVVSLGGDLAAHGAWPVAVGDPGDPVQVVEVAGGLATSSTTRRTWERGGRRHHHVLDPRTGRSAGTSWRTVSVAADSCVDANVASTASVVLGAGAPAWLATTPARLVSFDGTVVTTGGWPT
jgi:thiamine biosynthesis lipoprotein